MSLIYMRATVFEDKRAKFGAGAFVQPKHNGIRFLFDGDTAISKEGKEFLPHVAEMLKTYLVHRKGWVEDGELMLPKPYGLQDIQSAVTKKQELSELLYPVVFDLQASGPVFSDRMAEGYVNCQTKEVKDLIAVKYWYDQFLKDGHEGLIFRTNTPYIFGSAGRHLMKLKPHHDEEFLIIGVWEGQGKNSETPVFRCLRPDASYNPGDIATKKNSFGVVPEGTYQHKRELWKRRSDLIGKQLTIRYWDKYSSGVPQFPISVAVRDYE